MTAQTYEAVILWFQRDLESSSHRFAEVQEAHQSYGFEWGDAFCEWFLGSAAWFAGESTQAFEHNSRGLEIFRRVGDVALIAWTLIRLANIALESNELDQATALYDECLPMMDDLGDRHGVGAVLLGLGMAAQLRGETDEAQRLLVDAQTNLRAGGGGQGLSWPLSNVLVDTRTPRSARRGDRPVSGRTRSVGLRVDTDGDCGRGGLADTLQIQAVTIYALGKRLRSWHRLI